jgi:hypothetical protein
MSFRERQSDFYLIDQRVEVIWVSKSALMIFEAVMTLGTLTFIREVP